MSDNQESNPIQLNPTPTSNTIELSGVQEVLSGIVNYTLLTGDCLKLLSKLPPKSVHLLYGSLPFGQIAAEWDRKFMDKDYLRQWLADFWKEVRRVMVDGGVTCMEGTRAFAHELYMSNPGDFLPDHEWTVVRSHATGMSNIKHEVAYAPLQASMTVSVFCIGSRQPRVYNDFRLGRGKPVDEFISDKAQSPMYGGAFVSRHNGNNGERYIRNVIFMEPDRSPRKDKDERRTMGLSDEKHVSPSPLNLPHFMIERYTKEDDIVLDPTAGHASSGRGAVQLKRRWIGIELDPITANHGRQTLERTVPGDTSKYDREAEETNYFSQPRALYLLVKKQEATITKLKAKTPKIKEWETPPSQGEIFDNPVVSVEPEENTLAAEATA